VSVSLFGAIGSGLRTPLFICYDSCNGTTVRDFLNQVLENLAEPGKIVYLVLDNLSAHKPYEAVYRDEIKFLFYPPYSCRFNSVETLWAHVKNRFKWKLQANLKSDPDRRINTKGLLSDFIFDVIRDIPIQTIRNIEKANYKYV
jgi:hypothetical protein